MKKTLLGLILAVPLISGWSLFAQTLSQKPLLEGSQRLVRDFYEGYVKLNGECDLKPVSKGCKELKFRKD